MHQRKSNVVPGMLAYVVPIPGQPSMTPEILGRIVYVERESVPGEIITHVDGRRMRNDLPYTELVWWITAREPLPCPAHLLGAPRDVWWTHGRPLKDVHLRPIHEPGLDITEEDVRELFSPNETEVTV